MNCDVLNYFPPYDQCDNTLHKVVHDFSNNNNGSSTVRLFLDSPMKCWWLRPCIAFDMGLEMPHLDALKE